MNEKGQYYPAMLVIIAVIGVMALYVNLQNKIEKTGGYIGEAQISVLGVDNEILYYQTYVQEAAKQAMKKTVYNVASSGNCAYLNTPEKPKEVMLPNLQEEITTAFNKNMNNYAKQYEPGWIIPTDNFELLIEKDRITGVAIKPTIFPIKNYAGRQIGTAAYRPVFSINYAHGFDDSPDVAYLQCAN